MSDSEIIPFITLINSFTEVSEINRRQIISKFDLLEERKKNKINDLAQPLVDSDKQLLDLLENPFVSEKLTESGLINSIRTFQFNILFDYINKAIPDCNHEINQIYINFRKQFDQLNQLYIKKLNKKLYTMDGIYIDPDLNVDEKLNKIYTFTSTMVKLINETINIDEFSTPEEFKRELFQNNIRKIVSILNSNIFLKVLSILSTFRNSYDELPESKGGASESDRGGGASESKGVEDEIEGEVDSAIDIEKEYISELETIITNLSGGADGTGIIDFNNMIEDFFITWDETDPKDIHMIKIIDKLKLQKYVDRDTFIYNKHFPDSRNKAIFLFTFVNSITYAESYIIENIIRDEILPVIIIQLIKNISHKLYNYIQYSEIFHIKRKQITELYNKINKSYKHIFSYVKLNKYDLADNKRVQILPLENNSIIKMNYKNTDKINSEITDSDTKDEETYYFGRFDKVFDNSITYSEISDTIHSDIEQRINNFEDVCIIGYGQSGSGKTTTLLKGLKGEQNGVLTNLLEKISPNNIKVKIIELVVNPNNKPEDKSQVNNKFYKKDLIQLAETIKKLPDKGNFIEGFSTNDRGELSERAGEFVINEKIFSRNILEEVDAPGSVSYKKFTTKKGKYESIYDKRFNKRISYLEDKRIDTKRGRNEEHIIYDKNNTIKYFMEGQPYIFYKKAKENAIKYKTVNGDIPAYTNLVKVNLTQGRNKRGLLGLKKNISEFNYIEKSNITEIISEIKDTIQYRLERPTSNNSNSSRSHLFIDFEITKDSNNFHIILCDFAGVENEFDCDTVDIKNKFFKAYKDTVISIPSEEIIKNDLNKITQGKSITINNNCKNLLDEKSSLDDITKKNNCKKDMETRIQNLCEERKKEGYLINKTLSDLRFDISNFVKTIISSNNTSSFLPIFTDNDIYPYCRNININENYFETFYDYKADKVEPEGLINKIFREILGEEKYKKLIIILFTVILLNVKTGAGDSKKDYNNPPSIPYININKLIYYKETNASSDKLISEYRKIKNNMKKFNFYKKDSDIISDVGAAGGAGGASEFKDSDSVSSTESTDEDILEKIPAFIKKIKENNASTLVGSLETASMLQNLTFNKFTCFKEEIKTEDDTFIDDTINTLNSYGYKLDLDYSKKYLKYKKKYLMLKHKL